MDDGGALKITTARWYTPSGRCIDKPRDTVAAKLLTKETFTTLSPIHRKVYGAGGIIPDTIVGRKVYTWLEMEILRKGFYFDYAIKYTNQHKDIPKDFTYDSALLEEFKQFITDKDLKFTNAQFDSGKVDIGHALEQEIVAVVWGAKAAETKRIKDDHYVEAAIAILDKVKSTKDFFRINKK